MKKKISILLYLGLLVFQNILSQPKPEIKLIASKTQLTIYALSEIKAYLFNKGNEPIIIFRQDFSEPGWNGVSETWYSQSKLKTDTIHRGYDAPNSSFTESSIVRVNPGDSLYMDMYTFSTTIPGDYNVKYEVFAKRDYIHMGFAKNEVAKNAALTITEFKITSQSVKIKCKPVVFLPEQIKELPLSEVNTKPMFSSFASAFEAPENVFRFQKGGRINSEDIKAIRLLKNIHTLVLSDVYIIDDIFKKQEPVAIDLTGLTNIKELVIEGNEKIRNIILTGKLLELFPKLEKIQLKYLLFNESQLSFKNMNSLKLVEIADFDSNGKSYNFDLGPSQQFVKLDLYKMDLAQLSPISNLPDLKEIKFQNIKVKSIQGLNNLPSLSSITLIETPITEFPSTFGNLAKLHDLNLADDQLTTLPKEIGTCSILQFIILSRNKITSLPDEMKNLTKLTSIHLNENNLSNVFPVLFEMPAMVQLDLSKNNITVLPDNFGKLQKLLYLEIQENKISELPESILLCERLKEVKVAGNPISTNKTSKELKKKLKDRYVTK